MEALNYIDFIKLWDENKTAMYCTEYDTDTLKRFKMDDDVELMPEECEVNLEKNEVYIFFGETGGQNESDTQGWSRDYTITLDATDLLFKNIEYSQG